MKLIARIAVGTLLLAATAAAGAAELACGDGAPLTASVRLDYAVTASRSFLSLRGDGEVVYKRKGDAYTMESTLQAFGIYEAHQRSVGVVRAAGIEPGSFVQRTSRRPPRRVTFDWAAQRVTFSDNGESSATRPQMQDRLSLMLQLAWRHRHEPRAREIQLPVAGLRHDSDYLFAKKGQETLAVPGGRYDTVKFERRKDDGDDTLEVWLSERLCWLPVRLRFTDDKGTVVDQQLRGAHPL